MNQLRSMVTLWALITMSNISLAADIAKSNDRYNTIVAAFDSNTSSLSANFIPTHDDVTIIQTHQKAVQTKLTEQIRSSNPGLLEIFSILGTGFGLEAILMFLRVFDVNAPKKPLSFLEYIAYRVKNWPIPVPQERRFGYAQDMLHTFAYPLDIPIVEGVIRPIHSRVSDMYEDKSITEKTYTSIGRGVLGITSLISAGIAAYLLKKATENTRNIKKSTKELFLDEQIIESLARVNPS
jgi:hypothetical protein